MEKARYEENNKEIGVSPQNRRPWKLQDITGDEVTEGSEGLAHELMPECPSLYHQQDFNGQLTCKPQLTPRNVSVYMHPSSFQTPEAILKGDLYQNRQKQLTAHDTQNR